MSDAPTMLRRGLPRVNGGAPWPPAHEAPHSNEPAHAAGTPVSVMEDTAHPSGDAQPTRIAVRRGLPRISGGAPWPPEHLLAPATTLPAERQEAESSTLSHAAVASPPAPGTAAATPEQPLTPITVKPTVWHGRAPRRVSVVEPRRIGPYTLMQWSAALVVAALVLLFSAWLLVTGARALLSSPWGADFLEAFPGEYHLPAGAPVGVPAWMGWQHFFNVFLMTLIIRTGLQVRRDKRPAVLWASRSAKSRKISLSLWFHQSLDILWLLNGAVFVALLFFTGQWMRIVPTSWEVVPNALSAALQYLSLDWPTENGWVNYNSLQQLAYFATVFVAAPLAAVTGVRMSGVWPTGARRLSKMYPVEWARAVHFPVMIYFVIFIVTHVVLVLATGALRNLNHMYAAQGSVDPNEFADNWTGFWLFVASMALIIGAWVASRPLVLAPIARLFGTVSRG